MVNTTTPGLDLETGAVSSAILAKAGQGLQDDCKTKHPNGVKVGEVAVTKAHGLRVKEVYHLTLPSWSSPDSIRVSVESKKKYKGVDCFFKHAPVCVGRGISYFLPHKPLLLYW